MSFAHDDAIETDVAGEILSLHYEKAIYWKRMRTLILADVHIGKTAHFRKAGIAVPPGLADRNLSRMDTLIGVFEPERILVLGDLFHSGKNVEWDIFISWRKKYKQCSFELVPGNHDTQAREAASTLGLVLLQETYSISPFLFTHKPVSPEDKVEYIYNLSGHIHPAVRLQGPARQSLHLPCFVFQKTIGILPAFGEFTGRHMMDIRPTDSVFAIAEKKVYPVQ